MHLEMLRVRIGHVMRVRMARELLSFFRSTIHHPYFGIALLESENRPPRSPTGADHKHLRTDEIEALFQGSDNPGDISVKAVEFPVLRPNQRVTGADLGAKSIGLIKMPHDHFF